MQKNLHQKALLQRSKANLNKPKYRAIKVNSANKQLGINQVKQDQIIYIEIQYVHHKNSN
ncbi:unnamed protein product [Paramecium octaurelia]|uniref:Uncharacterized protein n=1 Tax=Paramecium octaurelia TaxID=43137 RepID=A0A8S1TSC2_PAROT|nr:unnamed protein product [Paramecium octaurelia]